MKYYVSIMNINKLFFRSYRTSKKAYLKLTNNLDLKNQELEIILTSFQGKYIKGYNEHVEIGKQSSLKQKWEYPLRVQVSLFV